MEETRDYNWEVTEIVKRAKQALGIATDSELAKYLGVSRATVSNWCARRRIDFALLLGKMEGVDFNWLLTGKGNEPLPPTYCHHPLAQGEMQLIHRPVAIEARTERTIPLYDIAAAANLRSLLAHKHQFVVGDINFPNAPVCDGAIYVSGDSMYPVLKSGDIIGFKSIHNFDNLIYGEMYIVSFALDGDEYLAVKYVNKPTEEGEIILKSYNDYHSQMQIPLSAVNAMAIVKFSVRRHTMI